MTFRKVEDGKFLTYKCRTLEDLLKALQSHQAHGYPMNVNWWGYDDESLCVDKVKGIPEISFEPKE